MKEFAKIIIGGVLLATSHGALAQTNETVSTNASAAASTAAAVAEAVNPAIWIVPLAITLMIVVSKAARKEVPADVRMKMLVPHAPEKLGLKQEYIQEHQAGH